MSNDNNNGQVPLANAPAGHAEQTGLLITSLADMPDKSLIDESYLAFLLKITKRTIRRMVSRNEIPPPVKFAGRSVWLAGRILSHIEAEAERNETRANRIARKMNEHLS